MNDSGMEKNEPAFTFRAVQIFVAAVEAESVTRAAHRLGMSPSSVSQQLANLEAALGTRLVIRSARSFRITEAGRLFLERGKRILDDVGAAKAELALADQAPPMTLRIACIEELDATVTATWLKRLSTTFPNIAFSLSSGASHENHDALSSRAVDLMLAVDTVAGVEWIEQHPILRDPFILVTAAGMEPGDGPKALAAHPFIRYSSTLQIGRDIEAQLRRTGVLLPRNFEFTTNQALFASVSALEGCALTTALAYLGTPLAEGLVTPHPLPLPGFSRRLALHARAEALGDLPRIIASEMRDCLRTLVLPQACGRLPFVSESFHILQ